MLSSFTMRRIWTFFDSVVEDRRVDLERFGSFVPILAGMRLTARVVNSIWEPRRKTDLGYCGRAAYRIAMPEFLVDAFFNSPGGYRAQYAISPRNGERMSHKVIDLLRTKLLSHSLGVEADRILASLDGEQAKVWIDEAEVRVERHLQDSTPEINFPRWIVNSESGVGLRAPIGTRLVVYGGWVDQKGRERLDPAQARRGEEIHHCGYV
jgi:hypothetical protein